jgi:protein-disulfide isomerase
VEPQVQQQLIDTGKAKFTYNHYIVVDRQADGESFRAAEASECAGDQGKFWQYHDILFQNQTGENVGAYADTKLKGFAQQAGLDMNTFNACFDGRKHKGTVEASDALGKSWGISATPTIFVEASGQRVQIQNPLDVNEIVQVVNRLSGAQ